MDAGALVNILRRPVTLAENTALERISLSIKLAISVAAAHGGRADLARELQALASRYPVVRLVQSPGAASRLEAGPFRFSVPGTLRDALLSAVRVPAEPAGTRAAATTTAASVASTTGAPASMTAGAGPPSTAVAPTAAAASDLPSASSHRAVAAASAHAAPATSPAEIAAVTVASLRAAAHWPATLATMHAAPKSRGGKDEAPPRLELPLAGPLFEESADATQAATRLQAALRASSVFTEAQLARTVAREREAAAAETVSLREIGRVWAELPQAEKTAAQLELLRRDAVAFALTPWVGQRARLDIVREPIDVQPGSAGEPDSAKVFCATLALDLPQLGAVAVRLRLVNSTLAASIESAEPQRWVQALPELAAQLQARGLKPAALTVSQGQQAEHHARPI